MWSRTDEVGSALTRTRGDTATRRQNLFGSRDHRFETKHAGPLLVGVWIAVLALTLLAGPDAWSSSRTLAVFALALFFAGVATLVRIFPTGGWSPATAYFLTFGVFHLGLAPYWVMQEMPPALTRSTDSLWFFGEYGKAALFLVAVGTASFVIGATLVSTFRNERDETVPPGEVPKIFSYVGGLTLIVSILLWAYFSIEVGGSAFYTMPYLQYFNAIGETPIPDLFLAIGFALCLVVIDRARGVFVVLAMLMFLGWGVVSFFMGTRGYVLFPLAAAATVIAWRRRMPRIVHIGGIFVLLLFFVNAAKQIRQTGIGSGFSWAEASPLNGLAELGSSMRVVALVAEGHDQGAAFAYGSTYSVWVVRVMERIAGVPSPNPDLRMFNVFVDTHAGAIGGSVVAEAFYNFGILGVVLVMLTLGVIFAAFSAWSPSPWRLAVYAAVAVPLFYQVRNSFVPVIPMTLLYLAAILTMRIFFSLNGQLAISTNARSSFGRSGR